MPAYYILQVESDDLHCAIWDYLDEFPDIENPAEGIPAVGAFPDEVRFQMSHQVPGLMIADLISNALGYLMVSSRGRSFLEANARAKIEYLRFTLLNHKARVASTDCYIANVLGTVDCVDRQRTKGDLSAVEPTEYLSISRLMLDPRRIPPDRDLFRIASQPQTLIVRDDLRATMEAMSLSGATFLDLGSDVDLE
jgi:hypothetical protein